MMFIELTMGAGQKVTFNTVHIDYVMPKDAGSAIFVSGQLYAITESYETIRDMLGVKAPDTTGQAIKDMLVEQARAQTKRHLDAINNEGKPIQE